MTLLAVAEHKLFVGVWPPASRLKKGSPSVRPGGSATYDWREPPGSAENTAHIRPAYRLIQHDDLLSEAFSTDAHFTCAILRRGGVAQLAQPRLVKDGVPWLREQGYDVEVETLAADLDNPGHATWSNDAAAIAKAQEVHALARTAAVYVTSRGLRLIQPLTQWVRVPDVEVSIAVWLNDLKFRLSATGMVVDLECDDWTRQFRAPHVKRDHRHYRSPAVLRTCEPIPPPDGPRVIRQRERARRRPLPGDYRIASVHDPRLDDVVQTIAKDLAGRYAGERHAVGLPLGGALLQLGAPRDQVPALVAAVARRAGWDPEHHRSGAIDTVRRFSDGYSVAGLAALPPAVREVVEFAFGVHRAKEQALPPSAAPARATLEEVTAKMTAAIRDAAIGVTVIKAQCGLGKTRAARLVAADRATRSGKKKNTRTSFAVPTTELAEQVTRDLREAGVPTTRIFGPLSHRRADGQFECVVQAQAAALARGGHSVRKLYCGTCEHESSCSATTGQDEQEGARVLVGPHALLADLDDGAGDEGLVFIDEPPALLRDEVFGVDRLVATERALDEGRFDEDYTAVMRPVVGAFRAWVEVAPLEQAGSVARAWEVAFPAVRAAVEAAPAVAPLGRQAVIAAKMVLSLAVRLGEACEVLRSLHRAIVRADVVTTVYDRGAGVSVAFTGLDRDVENCLIGARRDGTAKDRRVILAGADVHLHLDRYRVIAPDLVELDFEAPDGARIERTMMVMNGSRARLATDDPAPIEAAARLVVEWATEAPALASCGVVTFKKHESLVRKALASMAPYVRWEVSHYGAMRGLDRWKDFDGVATVGDPRPNLDAVSRELGGGGAEMEERYARAEEHARSELEQAHGRLRTVHRNRPGRALHVGAILPLGWVDEPGRRIIFRRPPGGRPRRASVSDLAELVAAVGGQRAAARIVGRSPGTVGGWLRGEGRPDAAAAEILRQAGTERRQVGHGTGDRESSVKVITGHSRSLNTERIATPVQVGAMTHVGANETKPRMRIPKLPPPDAA